MIPAPFDYEAAESVDHAIELLGTREEAGPDVNRIAALREIHIQGAHVLSCFVSAAALSAC